MIRSTQERKSSVSRKVPKGRMRIQTHGDVETKIIQRGLEAKTEEIIKRMPSLDERARAYLIRIKDSTDPKVKRYGLEKVDTYSFIGGSFGSKFESHGRYEIQGTHYGTFKSAVEKAVRNSRFYAQHNTTNIPNTKEDGYVILAETEGSD